MTASKTIRTALLLAESQLKAQDYSAENAKLEAQLLLQHLLNVNRAWLIAHADDALPTNIHAPFERLINRRLQGDPIAYILGYREFFGLHLKVSSDTLIPRPDTETLVEIALKKTASHPSFPRKRESILNLNPKMDSRFHANDELSILDLGTGTGAIALALAKNAPQANITAVDASEKTLNIALENALNLNLHNVSFVLSNWFTNLAPRTFDLIVSNPPYIEENDIHLSQGDVRFEPISALVSGIDGLNDIRNIIAHAPQFLKPSGWLMLEHGYNQATNVRQLLLAAGFINIETQQDLGGNERVTFGCFS